MKEEDLTNEELRLAVTDATAAKDAKTKAKYEVDTATNKLKGAQEQYAEHEAAYTRAMTTIRRLLNDKGGK